MKKFRITITTRDGKTTIYALAKNAKQAGENAAAPEDAFGITVIEL